MNYDVDINEIANYNTHSADLKLASTALIIIEMQNSFKGDIISDRQINNVRKLINFSDDNHMLKIFVQHDDNATFSYNMIDWWGGDKIEKYSDAWEIMDEFKADAKTIVHKNQYSAFHNTNLNELLKQNKISDVIICGVMTNCCCETTARDAFMHGYNVVFAHDATGTINADLHLAAIKNIAFGFASVLNTECVCRLGINSN
ncbi:MAG: isochorismatase family protein [Francisellaceae bacterium]